MTPENFVYWLQGYFEIHDSSDLIQKDFITKGLSEDQVKVIRQHLNLVLKKVTTNIPLSNPVDPLQPTYPQPNPMWPTWGPYTTCGEYKELTTTHTGNSAKPLC
jgi:hypothetical protein